MDDQRLGQFAFLVLLDTQKEALYAMDHLLNLIFCAIRELDMSKGVLNPSNLAYTDDHIFLRRRLPQGSAVIMASIWAKRSPFVVLFHSFFNLLETSHHFRVLYLHKLQLGLERFVLRDLLLILIIYVCKVRDDLGVLSLHLGNLLPPFSTFFVLLLLEDLALLLNPHLFDFKHLDLVIDVATLHGAQLQLILDLAHSVLLLLLIGRHLTYKLSVRLL